MLCTPHRYGLQVGPARETHARRAINIDNILVQTVEGEEHVKLANFALADYANRSTGFASCTGELAFSAQEALQGSCGPAANMYSAAAVLYNLLTGKTPFSGKTGRPSCVYCRLFVCACQASCTSAFSNGLQFAAAHMHDRYGLQTNHTV